MRSPSIALVLVLAIVTGGCSDDDGGGGAGGAGPTTTEAVGVLADVPLGVSVHSGGFVVDADEVRMVRDSLGRAFIELAVTIVNTGPEPAPFDVPARLEGSGSPVVRVPPDEPLVVETSTPADAVLRFPVPERVGAQGEELEEARIVFGAEGHHQAVIPFDGSPPSALVPRPVEVGAVLGVGHVDLTVHGGVLRLDDPLSHENLPEGRGLLVLDFDAIRGGGGAPNLTAENLRLRLPDATVIAVRRDGRSAPNVLLEAGVPVTGLAARFEVPVGTSGDHALIVVGPYGDAGREVRAELPFTVDAL